MSLRDSFLAWRDRRLVDPGFQHWVSTVPILRSIARRKANQAFDLCAGFVYSQVLQACVSLDVLDAVRDTPLTLDALARRIDFPLAGTERLAKAACALDLLSLRSGGRYGLGETGAALLGNPGVFSMVRHHAVLYRDLVDPVARLAARSTETELARYWAYAGQTQPGGVETRSVADYSDLMARTQTLVASEILNTGCLKPARHLMDVGGGLGAFITHAGRAYPRLELTVCDLPAVVALAHAELATSLPGRKVDLAGRDMFRDPLPTGADTISLIRILHDHDDQAVATLLAAVRATLPAGGRLVVAEPMAGTRGSQAMGEAYFGMYLWAMGSGRPRTAEELAGLLKQAGFTRIRERPSRQPLLTRILIAS